ncbi:ligand-binding sensor domain-containing protein [Sediminibacterium salmoneum]|uniref:ligand-binding sensor domain-containing protein n=1 Tax=Sediminibacterium salmoneum TaxID=426421 RepID=UPI0004790540|nr:sensor histidine kinase [Sediminibacterium salmoneum]
MKKLVLFFILNCVLTAVQSQREGYAFLKISKEDGLGLASNVTYTIYQDKQGFIWVGTANGLQRFDGNRFISYGTSKPNKENLPIADLHQILPIGKQTLLLNFASQGKIGLFNHASLVYETVPILSNETIPVKSNMRLQQDSKQNTYLTIHGVGLFRFDSLKKAFLPEKEIRLPKGFVSNHPFAENKKEEQLWFTSSDKGLAVYDQKTKQTYTSDYNPKSIPLLNKKWKNLTEIYIDKQKRFWIFSWPDRHIRAVYNYDGNQLSDTAGLNNNPQYEELRYFFESRSGSLWMYGTNALYSYNQRLNKFTFYKSEFGSSIGIQYEQINDMTEDRDGNIWIASDNGIFMTSDQGSQGNVVNFIFSETKGGIEITDILELSSGEFWLSTWGSGILTLNKNLMSYKNALLGNMPNNFTATERIQYQQVWSLYERRNGEVWLGCQGGKYMIYDTVKRKMQYHTLKELNGSTIRFITEDKKGNVWISSQRGDIVRYDGKQFEVVQQIGTIVRKIFFDNEGLLWITSLNQGLYCYSADGKNLIHHYTVSDKKNPLFQKGGDDIDQLNDSTLVYAAGALNFIHKKTKKVSWLTTEDGLPANAVLRIRKDSRGNLWMVTRNGLCRYNPVNGIITPYEKRDGIVISNLTTEADFLTSNQHIIFAGSNGLIYFSPSAFSNSNLPPDVAITDFRLFNRYIPVDSLQLLPKVVLKSDQNSFAISFSALSFLLRDKLTYYYKMEGLDKGWIKADRNNTVNYSFLRPGNYTFKIYCEDNEGNRSKNISTMQIFIRPPFWRTGWFISILLTLIALVAYTMHRLRLNKLIEVENIRTRVARDLHDDMGSTLSTINILSSMAKARISDPSKTGEYLNKISDNSQRMMEAMDDIVWSIKPSNDSMQKILARMREFAINVCEAKDIQLEFESSEAVNEVKLNMEARRDFFLIFKEAINNSAKYAKCTKIKVEASVIGNRLSLLILDNGIGFNVQEADNGNGLGNMRKRADALNGKMNIQSQINTGTTIYLEIPVQ